jgi:hypothetical protein
MISRRAFGIGVMAMAGDKLVAPLNAPPGVTPASGVQPGVSTGVEYARIVIVFGPSGSVSGVFVYPLGTTPGAGNPPVESVSNASRDPYGNAINPGISSQVPGGGFVSLFQGEAQFSGGSSIGGLPNGNLVVQVATELAVLGGPIISETASGGTLANPTIITTDPGTPAGTFGANWAPSGSGADGVVFTLGTDGWVRVLVDVRTTSAAPAVELVAIPAGYAPAQSVVCGTLSSASLNSYPVTATSGATPQLQVGSIPTTSGIRYWGVLMYPTAAIP